MALDKQKILSELGSVVNQLQSADCGCMGKLFSNSNQPNQNGNFQNAPMVSPMHDGCRRGCCHGHGCHGYNAPSAGEPFSGNRNCMGHCNPPKLYADTYNYLNNNLMQPVVKEVYDDLKSISPNNTMMNDPMGAQMGLMPGNTPNPAAHGQMGLSQVNTPNFIQPGQMGSMGQNQMPGGAVGNQNAMNYHHGPNVRFGNTNMGNMNNNMQMDNPNNQQQMGQITQPMQPMSGMGPNIVNMMLGDAKRTNNPNQGGTQGLTGNNAPQSPGMGQYNGGMPGNNPDQYNDGMPGNNPGQYNGGMPGHNPGQFNSGVSGNNSGQYNTMGMNNIMQGNPGAPIQNPNAQYMSQHNALGAANANMQGNPMDGKMGQMNPGSQQIQSVNPVQPNMNSPNPGYGQHNAGMAKFNEMFPGVMQGGDLGFDPMAIAIQMNPANQQRAAMDTMQKMMMSNGKGLNANASLLQPVINATNKAMTNLAQPPTNQVPGQQNMVPTSQQQQIPGGNTAEVPVSNNQVPSQPVPTHQPQYQGQRQQMIDPNTGAIVGGTLPTVYEGSENPNATQMGSPPPTSHQIIKEPIFPVDTSKNLPPTNMNKFRQQIYNTLGQPVDLLPADIYRTPEPNLPQTLSPQSIPRSDPRKCSNVKATVSKTSLMGNKPVGRTPSKGQLQQIYNQYKGSHSYTQQNIRHPENGASYSDGHLNVNQGNVIRQTPVEKNGGDSSANNAMNDLAARHNPDQVGDIAAAYKPNVGAPPADAEKAPVINSKTRNGLQDMKYTTYATSAAWTFHGATPAPYSTAYRFRYKA